MSRRTQEKHIKQEKDKSPYDSFAWFYDKYWGAVVANDFRRAAARLLLRRVAAGSHLLDLCCGTGLLAANLIAQGYRVTGIDSSSAMLRRARRNAPAGKFIRADVKAFRLPEPAAGAIAFFDSLNHLLTPCDLLAALRAVHAALAPGALFVFDINTEVGYQHHVREHHIVAKPDGVLALRGDYDSTTRLATFDATIFRRIRAECWQRSDFRITERCYETNQVYELTQAAGFDAVRVHDATVNLNLTQHTGRLFFVARKPRAHQSRRERSKPMTNG